MSFWSDTTLRENLENVIEPANPDKVDISGYRLSVGDKVYITNDIDTKNESNAINLSINDHFEIPAGQFALILTKEKITIPKNVMGLISMRAKTKFKGLINVSGFHVDPGYSDNLIFAVFNAGPKSVPISKNDDIFLIWFAELDQPNSREKNDSDINGRIPTDLITNLNMRKRPAIYL